MCPRDVSSSWKLSGKLIINSQMLSALPIITLMMVMQIFRRTLGFKDNETLSSESKKQQKTGCMTSVKSHVNVTARDY